MIKLFLFFLTFNSLIFSQENFVVTSPDQLKATASIELVRKKEPLYSTLKTRVRLNGIRVTQVKNGNSESINIPEGRNMLAVSAFGFPGESTISFIAKSGENYSFVIAPRSSSFWAGMVGGLVGVGTLLSTAFEATLNYSEGGAFGIALQSSSKIEKLKNQKNKTNIKFENKSLEKELIKLKELFKKGLISEEVYLIRQKELISE